MSAVVCRRGFNRHLIRTLSRCAEARRHLLSPSYHCSQEWDKRLESPLLSKVNLDKLFNDINGRFNRKAKVQPTDIDLFVNVVNDVSYLEACEHILRRFRRTWRTRDTLESTHHAIARAFVKHDQVPKLLNLLEQRIEFGIFPDNYCYNLILDHLIEKKDFKNAARVAILKMLQEDFANPIGNILCLYAMHNYLFDPDRKPINENPPEVTDEAEDDDDITYVRIPFLRNAFFDDHFDLKDENHLCGKTLYLLGRNFDDEVGRSYQLYGLSLYGKWKKASDRLSSFVEKKCEPLFNNEILEPIENLVESMPDDGKDSAREFLNRLKEYKDKASSRGLAELVNEKLKDINDFETADMENVKSLYGEFEKKRESVIEQQLYELMREEKMKEIQKKIGEMAKKEKELYFFENFNKIEMEYVEAQKAIEEAKKSSQVDEDYIPPKI